MMRSIYTMTFSVVCFLCIFFWTGCSDEFLKEKKNYSNLTPDIYNDYTGAKMRVEDIYLRLLPNVNDGLSYRSPSSGKADLHSQSTEEFSGLSNYVNPDVVITASSNLEDRFHVSKSTSAGPWGEIRNCNDAIEGISGSTLADEQKEELLGQVYFFRAWQYYLLVKTYGGVPIVKTVQAADVSEAQGLAVPRSTTKECIDFICEDLELAAGMLPARWGGDDFGRITKGAALALAGRARLLYAAPLFNRADDKARWQAAYDANKAAIAALNEGKFGLAYEGIPGLNASGWAKMLYEYNSDEAVFVTLYNKVHDDNASHEIYRNNRREQSIRPGNANGGGGMTPTSMMVDLFPMKDGKKPGDSKLTYDNLKFFIDRDPRFYRTFAFPGVYWRFEGDPSSLGDDYPYPGNDYVLWNYSWYAQDEKKSDITKSGYGADGLGLSYKGMYIRKRSNDFDMDTPEPVCLYRWDLKGNRQGSFGEGAMPYMEIRYAEVLLNLAEAACGIDQGQEALDILRRIRRRVGYDAGDCGLNDALVSDRSRLFGAILYERQIELAYEGKRFDDMRRWLLWDGGENMSDIEGAPSSWTLSGFGGNTCTYLEVQAFNGKRRDNMELTTKFNSNEAQGQDPITNRTATLDLKEELTTNYQKSLGDFYGNNLVRKVRQGDKENKQVKFEPKYYIIGLTEGAQKNNITLLQTIGWEDVRSGTTNGTFDPLAE